MNSDRITQAIAKKNWDADRAHLREHEPWWPMRSWGRAAAWEKRPYLLAAEEGKHPDELANAPAARGASDE